MMTEKQTWSIDPTPGLVGVAENRIFIQILVRFPWIFLSASGQRTRGARQSTAHRCRRRRRSARAHLAVERTNQRVLRGDRRTTTRERRRHIGRGFRRRLMIIVIVTATLVVVVRIRVRVFVRRQQLDRRHARHSHRLGDGRRLRVRLEREGAALRAATAVEGSVGLGVVAAVSVVGTKNSGEF
jgi:hypothetical protein